MKKNNKKISIADSHSGLIKWGLASTFILLLTNTPPGMSGEHPKKRLDYAPGKITTGYSTGEKKPVELVIKYLTGGEIEVFDQNGEKIAQLKNKTKQQGPLTELRNITITTVTENTYDKESKKPDLGFIEHLIPPANAAVSGITYEYHVTTIDGDVVSCRKHRVTPPPHAYVGNC